MARAKELLQSKQALTGLLQLYLCLGGSAALPAFYLLNPTSSEFSQLYGSDLSWAAANVPFFEASDTSLTAAFAYRWKLYKRHIVATPGTWNDHAAPSFVVTEFDPAVKVGQGGLYNTINCAAMLHINEGRWLRNRQVMQDYGTFWLKGGGQARRYTFPLAHTLLELAKTHGGLELASSLLPELVENFEQWHFGNFVPERGLYYQTDTADGGEDSISGSGLRPSINFAMVAEQRALASLFAAAGNTTAAAKFAAAAESLQQRTITQLWNPQLEFFSTVAWPYPPNCTSPKAGSSAKVGAPLSRCVGAPVWPNGTRAKVRELLALSTPYLFRGVNFSDAKMSAAWLQLFDSSGFSAHWGPRTAERRAKDYNFTCDHACLWNAPSWPFETSRTATALANYLTELPADVEPIVNVEDYWSLLSNYTRSIVNSTVINPVDVYGRPVPEHPWVGEDIHPDEGYWMARAYLYAHNNTHRNRGWMYNHASYCDNILHGLVGIRSSLDQRRVSIHPLVPDGALQWFAADAVLYHNFTLTIFWDRDGSRYKQGAGFQVWVDGKVRIKQPMLSPLTVQLPALESDLVV